VAAATSFARAITSPELYPRFRVPGDGRSGVEVVAPDGQRTVLRLHLHQGAQRDHLPLTVPDLKAVDVFDLRAEPARRLEGNLPVPPEVVEAVDVG